MIGRIFLLLALLGLFSPSISACPFCGVTGQTLTNEVAQAGLIVFGTMTKATLNPTELGRGTTEMAIEIVVKPNDILKGKKTLTLPRYLPPDPKNPRKYLVFIEVFNGQIDPYRGEAVDPESKIAEYLKGTMEVRDKGIPLKMLYFFKWLDSPETTISNDALMEFGNADYKDYAPIASKLPPDTLKKWLEDENTPPSRFGLYGSLLGHCGNKEVHAPVLRKMLEDPKKRTISGMDGLLAGYILLDPVGGWDYTMNILKDTKSEFLTRYAALRAVRFFHDFRSEVIKPEQQVEAMKLLIDQGDISDLAIDDLRKWGRWEVADKVLALYGQASHNVPIVRRSIIRYALSVPKNEKAAAFVAKMREEQPERVRDIEELLKQENTPPPMPKK